MDGDDDASGLPRYIQPHDCAEYDHSFVFAYYYTSDLSSEPTLYHVHFVVEQLQEVPFNYVVRLVNDCDASDPLLSHWASTVNAEVTFSVLTRLEVASRCVQDMFYGSVDTSAAAFSDFTDDSRAVAFPVDHHLSSSSSSRSKRSRHGDFIHQDLASCTQSSSGSSIGISRLGIDDARPVDDVPVSSAVVASHLAATSSASPCVVNPSQSNKPAQGALRLARWSFTLFDTIRNGTELVYRDDVEKLKQCLDPANAQLRYFVYQIEKCPHSGRPHAQGYFELQKSVRHSAAKKLFVDPDHRISVHIDGALKGFAANKNYCTKEKNKDGTPARWPGTSVVEYGNPSMYGENEKSEKKSVLRELIAELHNGKSLYELEHKPPDDLSQDEIDKRRACIALKRSQLVTTEASIIASKAPSTRNVFVEVIYGPPGTGKSRIVDERYKPRKPSDKPFHEVVFRKVHTTGAWFDGYKGQPVLVLDDFDGWLEPHTVIQILDKYHMNVQVKGSCVPAMWEHVIILSNKHPKDWWNYRENMELGLAKTQQICKPHQMESILSRIGDNIREVSGEDQRKFYRCDKFGVPANEGFVDPDI